MHVEDWPDRHRTNRGAPEALFRSAGVAWAGSSPTFL